MSNNVTRKAILIGCPGSENSYLHGVAEDLVNMKNFLQSDKGGRWFSNEVITLNNPTFERLFQIVHSTNTDYNFIYFSGHGFTSQKWKRMLALRDNNIEDLFFINDSPRQLIVIDACRNYVASGISGIPDLGEQWEHFDGVYEARTMFDRYIANSPYGKTIVHATQIGHFSYDSSTGGYFTKALLNITTRVKSETYKPIFINKVVAYLPQFLQRQNNPQIPEIAYTEGQLKVPFAIAVPQINIPKPKPRVPQRQLVTANNNSSGAGWALLGIAAIFLIAASSSKK
jgi:hypothetical protein